MAELTLQEARRILADCDTSDPARAIAAVAMVLRFEGIADEKLLPIAGQLESVADGLRTAGVAVPAKLVTHCPWCAAPVSVADEPYCANADCRWNNGGTLPELLSMTVADVLRIVDANPTRQDIERALIANLPSNGGPRAPGVRVPVSPSAGEPSQ